MLVLLRVWGCDVGDVDVVVPGRLFLIDDVVFSKCSRVVGIQLRHLPIMRGRIPITVEVEALQRCNQSSVDRVGMHKSSHTFALVELLAAFVSNTLELRAELLHFERLEPVHLFFLLQQLLLLARLALLTRLFPRCVLASDEVWEVTRMAGYLSRPTTRD